MARYRASIETPWPPDEVFTYLSGFSTSAGWDPGVVEAERLDGAGRENATVVSHDRITFQTVT